MHSYEPEEYDTSDHSTKYLDSLNPEQLDAVQSIDGPLLVLAGAGTGKTKVLTTRIAHIIFSKKAFSSQILAVTFTNKAAKEMRARVDNTLGASTEGMWLGTFHAIAAKILRRHAEQVGLTRDFVIIDYDDQIKLAKQILNDAGLDDKKNPPKMLLYFINRFKDKAWMPNQVPQSEEGVYASGKVRDLYATYQARLKSLNAVDFGDLTLLNIELFNNHTDLLLEYQNKFKYILVDEYQDTNVAQYLWLRMLAQRNTNICCVGDDDQSIYGWRGAEVTNILRFDKDFKDAKIVRLERNYRSTGNILNAATELISNNLDRHGKGLWTEGENGSKIKLSSFYNDREEARYIAEEIETLRRRERHAYSQIAILVRAGYQTRSFEESLNSLRIPYRIIGGVKFYERIEIKDSIAYIRLLINKRDGLAFERIINTPKRGLGDTAVQKMVMFSKEREIPIYEAAQQLLQAGEIKGKAMESLQKFFNDFAHWEQLLSVQPHWQVVSTMLDESGYINHWKFEGTEESKERLDNIKELLRSLEDFNDLREYLEHISLITDSDSMQDEDKVNVMTMHAAKGLEFETVFLPGWEEGVFPSQKALDEGGKKSLEEERRLAYVGITRAKENLYICYACNRRIYGGIQPSLPSRFLDELPKNSYEIMNNFGSYYNKEYGSQSRTKVVDTTSSYNPEKPVAKYKLGQRVFHTKFGYGIILNIVQDTAEIAFEKSGIKKVLMEYISVG